MDTPDINFDSLIKEYEKTQEMIRHYDNITLRFSSMTQSGVLIFIGLSFGLLSKQHQMFTYLFPFVILFVIMINCLIHFWFKRHRSISQIKIRRILEIEKMIGWKQFTLVDEGIKSNIVESHPVGKMIIIYHVGLPFTLIVAYVIVLCSIKTVSIIPIIAHLPCDPLGVTAQKLSTDIT